jgi:hypothetical protein
LSGSDFDGGQGNRGRGIWLGQDFCEKLQYGTLLFAILVREYEINPNLDLLAKLQVEYTLRV